jgi:hypothetical protein
MNYIVQIDPCRSCSNYNNNLYDFYGKPDFNTMNNCCNNTLSAFVGRPSLNAIVNIPGQNCDYCMRQIINQQGPFPGWYHQRPYVRAPIFVQTPHYVPGIIQQGYNPEQAKNICIQMCNARGIRNPDQCRANCVVDADSIINIIPRY